MAKKTSQINKVTGTVISVTLKLLITAAVVLCLWAGAVKGFEFGYEIFNGTAVSETPGVDNTFEVKEGDTIIGVGKSLEKSGLIKSGLIFRIQGKFFDYEITPGTYALNSSMTSREMLELIDAGPKEEDNNDSK